MDALKSKGQMYDQINLGGVDKSGFDLTFYNKGTGKIGQLIPTRCTEVLPGDKFTGKSSASVQFEPLAVPILANMNVRQEHFFVPTRILWNKWESFITGGKNMDDTSVIPTFTLNTVLDAVNKVVCQATPAPPSNRSILWTTFVKGKSNTTTPVQGYYVYTSADVNDFNRIAAVNDKIKVRGDMYGITDLLRPMNSAVENLLNVINATPKQEYVDAASSTGNRHGIRATAVLKEKPFTVGDYVNGMNPANLLIKESDVPVAIGMDQMEIDPAVLVSLCSVAGINSSDVYMFSPEYVSILRAMYDIYNMWLGTSSYLDYMNAPRVKFVDWLYAAYQTYIEHFKTDSSFTFELVQGSLSKLAINALPFRALYDVWYNYYRDQLLETSAKEPSTSDTITNDELCLLLVPRQRCWRKDVFTTALANTGTGSMVVPTSVVMDRSTESTYSYNKLASNSVGTASAELEKLNVNGFKLIDGTKIEFPTRYLEGLSKTDTVLSDDGFSQNGFSLDMLNRAQRMQKWLMKNLIYGNRIQDSLYTHFGVKSSDARLDLPEYVAGSSSMVRLDTIVNNTTVDNTVAGDKAANAYGFDDGSTIDKFCEEHGFLISYFTIMPECTYSYSSSRLFSKLDKFDYAWPEFAQIGMDAVYNSELMCPAVSEQDALAQTVFGYQGRYYDYKSKQDEEHGELQTTQNMYTFSREFSPYKKDSRPKLNYEFVHCWPTLDMFVVEDKNSDYFRYDIEHSLGVSRVLPVCGTNL